MRLSRTAWLFLLWLTPASACGTEPASADEQILHSAGLATDGLALLDLFRKRTPTHADGDQVRRLIRQLGADSFAVREHATAELIALGPVAADPLRQAVN